MHTYLGILGDPAKFHQYDPDFYRFLTTEGASSIFYLLGASEDDVNRTQVRKMYQRIVQPTGQFDPIPGLSSPTLQTARSRIGLFPSSLSQLIRGPSFAFGSVPVNSTSRYLKMKSNLLQFALSPFLPFITRKVAYFPLGGKAAAKTRAKPIDHRQLPQLFFQLREQSNYDWYYLEAGSGQEALSPDQINMCLAEQARAILNLSPADFDLKISELPPKTRIVVPRTIYGGGINDPSIIRALLAHTGESPKFVPRFVIVGNVSEEDITLTYRIFEELRQLNNEPVTAIDSLQ